MCGVWCVRGVSFGFFTGWLCTLHARACFRRKQATDHEVIGKALEQGNQTEDPWDLRTKKGSVPYFSTFAPPLGTDTLSPPPFRAFRVFRSSPSPVRTPTKFRLKSCIPPTSHRVGTFRIPHRPPQIPTKLLTDTADAQHNVIGKVGDIGL